MSQVLVVSLLVMEARLLLLVVTLLLLPMGLQMQARALTCQLMPPLSQFASRRRLQMQAAVLTHQFTPPLSQLTSLRRQMSYNWMMTTTPTVITLSTRHQHLGEQSRGHTA
jgi:hypothetical protein